jgi:hypothetical protein
MTTSSHTLASVSADLVANGIPKRDNPFTPHPREDRFCWFVTTGKEPHERFLVLRNPHTTTELSMAFVSAYCPDAPDRHTWRLDRAVLLYELPSSVCDREVVDYDHTTIRNALTLLDFIDRHNAKHGIPTA